ncbi:hypothetical protein ACQY0O_007758 [Thecaphora frezii]
MSAPLSQHEAQRLFDTNAFLLLSGLPARTQLTLDAHPASYLTDPNFRGIKFLPAGWHCIGWSVPSTASPSDSQSAPTAPQASEAAFGVKHVLLRYFDAAEVAVRSFDRSQERIIATPSATAPSSSSSSAQQGSASTATAATLRRWTKLRRRYSDAGSADAEPPTVVSKEYLQSADAHLLPYPREASAKWDRATLWLSRDRGSVGKRVVARVVGLQPGSGDAVSDSMATGPDGDEDEKDKLTRLGDSSAGGREENGKRIWGNSRPVDDEEELERFEVATGADEADEEGDSSDTVTLKKRKRSEGDPAALNGDGDSDGDDDATLRFTQFDLRRSWPRGAIGETLTRWSQDKSFLLTQVLERSALALPSGAAPHAGLLCELELAFVLFLVCHNHHAFAYWTKVVALFCGCNSFLGATTVYQPHPSTPAFLAHSTGAAPSDVEGKLGPHADFLATLAAQLDLLPADFWTDQPAHEAARLVKQLETLRATIGRALVASAARSSLGQRTGAEDRQAPEADSLIAAWRHLSYLAKTRFGWELDRQLDEEKEVEDEIEDEEGEDAPLVVEL